MIAVERLPRNRTLGQYLIKKKPLQLLILPGIEGPRHISYSTNNTKCVKFCVLMTVQERILFKERKQKSTLLLSHILHTSHEVLLLNIYKVT